MEHYILRCKHCKKEYTYCTYGNEDGCSKEYCSECQKAINDALKSIPVKFKPVRARITDEKEKQKILKELENIKSEAEKNNIFNVVSLLTSNKDNIDRYTYNGKTYYVEYDDETPNDKCLSVEAEYDIINEKTTSKFWRATNKNTFQHGRSYGSIFKSLEVIPIQKLNMPDGQLLWNDY